eukprot:621515-Pleurochrysis_carterae.AAC.2
MRLAQKVTAESAPRGDATCRRHVAAVRVAARERAGKRERPNAQKAPTRRAGEPSDMAAT